MHRKLSLVFGQNVGEEQKRSSPKFSPIYSRNESERHLNKERSLRLDLIQFSAELNFGVEPTTISAKQEQTRGSESGSLPEPILPKK